MGYYDAYDAILSVTEATPRDRNIALSKIVTKSTFKNSPSYVLIQTYTPTTPLSSTPLDVWITDDSNTEDRKKIIAIPDQNLSRGYLHIWKNQYWLTTQTDEDFGDIYSRGVILRCFTSLKWLDQQGIVRESWFSKDGNSASNYGVVDGQVIIMPNERRQIIVQKNIYTTLIKKEQRFIFDERAWRVISLDKTVDGIIKLTVEENLINEADDNLELRIADYYNNLHTYTISILNGSIADLATGETLQLNIQVKDNDVVSNLSVTYTSSDITIATISSSGLVTSLIDGDVTITVTLTDHHTVHTSILISVSSIVIDNFTIAITGADICKVGQSINNSIDIRNNGIVDVDKTVVWSLMNDTLTGTTDLASVISQTGTGCSIKGLKYLTNPSLSYARLIATCIQDGSLIANKRIQIKSVL